MGVTDLTKNRSTERDVEYRVFEFTPDLTTAVTNDDTVAFELPKGTKFGDGFIQTVQAEAGATSSLLSIFLAPTAGATAGTTALITGTANNGGAVGTDYGVASPHPTMAEGDVPWTVFARYTQVGTATTKAIYRVWIRCFRDEYTL